MYSSNEGHNQATSNNDRADRIKERFERQFLPRFGNLWRNMVEQQQQQRQWQQQRQPHTAKADAVTTKASQNSMPPTNFLDAIENKTSVHLQVPTAANTDENDCACCVPPILEADNQNGDSDLENRIHNAENAQYRWAKCQEFDGSSSDSDNSDDNEFLPDDNNDQSSQDHSVSTPLPADLNQDFGKLLNFGAATEEESENEDSVRQASSASSKSQAVNAPSDEPLHGSDVHANDADVDNSSGSEVMRFDISHILVDSHSPTKGDADVGDNLFSEQPRPQFSPQRRDSEQPENPVALAKSLRDSAEDSSESSMYQVDLSYMVQSPEKNLEPVGFTKAEEGFPKSANIGPLETESHDSKDYTPDDDESFSPPTQNDFEFAAALKVAGTNNESLIIDLLDSDEEIPPFAANNMKLGVDSSDESVDAGQKPPARTKKSVHINEDNSSEEFEWDEASSDEPYFESPDESDDDINIRRKSISKLARGTRSSPDGFDSENLHPNYALLSKGKRSTVSAAAFKKNRDALSKKYFQECNSIAFDGKISSVEVVWSNKLRTTAGLTRLKRRQMDFTPGSQPTRLATIELSTKILDNSERLRSTLAHEACHAAAWIVDGVSKPPHGACFKKWANIVMRRIPGVQVTTTHDYQIQYKYAWACTNPSCNFLVQRHSRSVDLERQCCGRCRGRLIEVDVPDHSSKGNVQRTPKKRAPPSAYNLFVKEQSKTVRERLAKSQREKVSQADVMKECARLWREKKEAELAKE